MVLPPTVEEQFYRDAKDSTTQELAEKYSRSPRTIRRWKQDAGKPIIEGQSALEAWQSNTKKPTWKEILAHAEKGAVLQQQLRPVFTHATRTISTCKPIFLVHMADFHLGAPSTDYQAFLDTTDFLLSHDDFYFLVAGPDLETAFAWFYSAECVLNQTIPPWMQIEAYKCWMDEMLPKCLAVVSDNHTDARLEKVLGDIGILWREDVPYFRTFGVLDIVLDNGTSKVTYQGMVAHKWRGSSIYHDLQPALRMMRKYPNADWYCTAHTHKPAYMRGSFFEEMGTQHLIVCGTFKTGEDIYGLREFGHHGVLGLPTLMLDPYKKQMTCFESPQMAWEATHIQHSTPGQ